MPFFEPLPPSYTISLIISGGQTGADIAAVDAAIDCSVPYSGTLPYNRLNEEGTVPERYSCFIESTGGYASRTKKNLKHADGTVVFFNEMLVSGSKLTANYCLKYKKPLCLIDVSKHDTVGASFLIQRWLSDEHITILNVAGPRASKQPLMYNYVYRTISIILKNAIY